MPDKYLYPNSNVLINKEGIKSQEKLDLLESAIVNTKLVKLYEEGFLINDPNDIFKIHKILFEEIYDWAGYAREVNIYKEEIVINNLSVEYEDYSLINEKIKLLDEKLKSINWNNFKKVVDDLVIFISIMWKIHPFREGNTRSVVTYLYFLVKKNNYNLNTNLIRENAKYFRNALVMASIGEYSDYSYLKNILSDALTIDEITTRKTYNKNKKYQSVNNIEMSDYKYNYHTTKK